jgi:hypothetical protein
MTHLPNAFLAGLPKCGTTSMAAWLAGHPQVQVSRCKEPHFWCPGFQDGTFSVRDVISCPAAYDRLFAGSQPGVVIRLDGSTTTLWYPGALEAIRQSIPSARMLVMLRNPLEMVSALHAEECFALNETENDFTTAWRLQDVRAAGRRVEEGQGSWMKLQYRWIAQASRHVRRLDELFPPAQICLVVLDDVARDPRHEYLRVLEFLEVEDDGRRDFPRENSSNVHAFPALSRWMLQPPQWIEPLLKGAKERLHRFGFYGWRSGILKRLKRREERPPLQPDLMEELRHEFDGDIDWLGQRLGRDLSAWKRGERLTA